jgi:DNA (cytosine-5)-methyltransferase 1
MGKQWKVISLFCGCGGSDLGLVGGFNYLGKRYKKNPIEIIHASDIDKFCIETYNANFKHPAELEDIRMLNFVKYSADIVVGGFPCQSFSTLNPTKKPDLKENQLFWEMARVVNEVRPKVFVAENVKGFYRLYGGKYFKMAKKQFESLGYDVHDTLFKSVEYGIPQKRERMVMIGVRKDITSNFAFPIKTHGEEGRISKGHVPLKEVIDSLIPEDEKFYFSKKAVEGVKKAKPNMKRAVWQDLEEPCLTITSHLAKVSIYSRDPILLVDPKKELYRRFTPREAARIQSFPDSFKFPVSDTQAYRQVGNAIPPLMMWHLTQSIVKLLNTHEHKTSSRAPEQTL